MSTALYVDIHALQTVPYANLNRDDLGSPKTVIYGGAERTRVSSQSWKRVVRHESSVGWATPRSGPAGLSSRWLGCSPPGAGILSWPPRARGRSSCPRPRAG